MVHLHVVLAGDDEGEIEEESGHEEVHQETSGSKSQKWVVGQHLGQGCRSADRGRSVRKVLGQQEVRPETQASGQPEEERGPQNSGEDRPANDADGECRPDGNPQDGHCRRPALGLDEIGNGGKRDGNNGTAALN